MELYEIPLLIVGALVFIPIIGATVGAFVGIAWNLIEKLIAQSEVWTEQYGEFKSRYAVAFIIGTVFLCIAFAYIFSSSDSNSNPNFY